MKPTRRKFLEIALAIASTNILGCASKPQLPPKSTITKSYLPPGYTRITTPYIENAACLVNNQIVFVDSLGMRGKSNKLYLSPIFSAAQPTLVYDGTAPPYENRRTILTTPISFTHNNQTYVAFGTHHYKLKGEEFEDIYSVCLIENIANPKKRKIHEFMIPQDTIRQMIGYWQFNGLKPHIQELKKQGLEWLVDGAIVVEGYKTYSLLFPNPLVSKYSSIPIFPTEDPEDRQKLNQEIRTIIETEDMTRKKTKDDLREKYFDRLGIYSVILDFNQDYVLAYGIFPQQSPKKQKTLDLIVCELLRSTANESE